MTGRACALNPASRPDVLVKVVGGDIASRRQAIAIAGMEGPERQDVGPLAVAIAPQIGPAQIPFPQGVSQVFHMPARVGGFARCELYAIGGADCFTYWQSIGPWRSDQAL